MTPFQVRKGHCWSPSEVRMGHCLAPSEMVAQNWPSQKSQRRAPASWSVLSPQRRGPRGWPVLPSSLLSLLAGSAPQMVASRPGCLLRLITSR